MTLSDIKTFARQLTNTDTVSWTDAQLLINLNAAYQKVVSMILESADEGDFDDLNATDYPIMTTPLVAGQRDYQIPVTEGVLKIKRVDTTYDGSNWYLTNPIDDGTSIYDMGANAANTDQNFSTFYPRYDMKYNSVWIYPVATQAQVDAGAKIRIEWERQVTEFTSGDLTTGTLEPGFDRPFHSLVPYTMAFDYATSRQLPQMKELQTQMQDWENRLRTHYGRRQLDRRLQITPFYTSSNYS